MFNNVKGNGQVTASFAKNFKKTKPRSIGIELEFPLVEKSGWAPTKDQRDTFFTTLKQAPLDHNIQVSEELGSNVLELGIGPAPDLFSLSRLSDAAITAAHSHAAKEGIRLLGYGIHPFTKPGRAQLTATECFQLYEKASQYSILSRPQGADIHLFTIAASCQVHVDVCLDEAVTISNLLNSIAGVQLALTANSSIWDGAVDPGYKAVREGFYDLSYDHKENRQRNQFGVSPWFTDMQDYINFISRQHLTTLTRSKTSYYIEDTITKGDFLAGRSCVGKTVLGQECRLTAVPEDIFTFAGQVEFSTRLAPKFGTIESRISCQQPPNEVMTVPALVLGCVENYAGVKDLLEQHPNTNWHHLRRVAITTGMQDPVLHCLAGKLLDIAQTGLTKRQLGEDVFLHTLKTRHDNKQTPADHSITCFENAGSREDFISQISYGKYHTTNTIRLIPVGQTLD